MCRKTHRGRGRERESEKTRATDIVAWLIRCREHVQNACSSRASWHGCDGCDGAQLGASCAVPGRNLQTLGPLGDRNLEFCLVFVGLGDCANVRGHQHATS